MDLLSSAVQTAAGTLISQLTHPVMETPVTRQPITFHLYAPSLSLCVSQVEQAAVRDAGDDIPVKPPVLRPLDRQLAEHKDVTKSVTQCFLSLVCQIKYIRKLHF